MQTDAQFEVDLEGLTLKARPATEGDRRLIYCEPSNENWDSEKERVLQKALFAAAPGYLRFGNLDIGHKSMIGHRLGLQHPELYEIGTPLGVIADGVHIYRDGDEIKRDEHPDLKGKPVMVKGEIYRGDGISAEQANIFWSSLHQLPAQRWFPSVGGRPTAPKECRHGKCTISHVEWRNVAFAKEPVNATVKAVSLMPLDGFWKAVTAGYHTDVAGLTGGQAVQRQSIHRRIVTSYPGMAARFLKGLGTGACPHSHEYHLAGVAAHFKECEGLAEDEAKACASRLIRDVSHRVKKLAA